MRYRLRKPSAFFLSKEEGVEIDDEAVNDYVEDMISDGDNLYAIDDEGEEDDDYDVDDDDESEDDNVLPYSIRSRHSVASDLRYPDVESVMMAVIRGEIKLRRAEGLRFAYIDDTLFIDGEVRFAV